MALYSNGTNYSDDELLEASHYPVVVEWSQEDQLFLAMLPDMGRMIVHGSSPEEAVREAIRAGAQFLYAMRELGEPIPQPTSVLAIR